MNKGIVFALGVLAGAAGGGAVTYLVTRRKFDDEATEEIRMRTEYYQNRIEDLVSYYEGGKDADDTFKDEDEDSNEDEKPNEGVKKYHRYAGDSFSKKNVNKVVEKMKEADVTEGQKAIQKDPTFKPEIEGISEISEEEFNGYMDDPDIGSIYLDFDFNTDELTWGAGTDNEILAEQKFGMGRDELIGQCWKWAPEYVDDETGVGSIYILNENIGRAFNITVHFNPEEDVVES